MSCVQPAPVFLVIFFSLKYLLETINQWGKSKRITTSYLPELFYDYKQGKNKHLKNQKTIVGAWLYRRWKGDMLEVKQIKLYEKYLKALLSEGNEKDDVRYL